MMKKSFVLVLFLCMGIASLNVSAQRSGTSETVLLRVSFEPEMSDTTACAVCGDGLGDYIDGVDGVSASSHAMATWESISEVAMRARDACCSTTQTFILRLTTRQFHPLPAVRILTGSWLPSRSLSHTPISKTCAWVTRLNA